MKTWKVISVFLKENELCHVILAYYNFSQTVIKTACIADAFMLWIYEYTL
jgi:hypothetical protein